MKLSISLIKKSFAILLIAVTLIGIFVFKSGFFDIKELEFKGDKSNLEYANIYANITANFSDSKIFQVDTADFSQFVSSIDPRYKVVDLQKIFPNKLVLSIEERLEKYTVDASNGKFVVDQEGYVLGETDSKGHVSYDGELQTGEYIGDALLESALYYTGLGEMVIIDGENIKIELPNGGSVLLPKKNTVEDTKEIVIQLQKIIQKYTIERIGIDTLDLRFSKPIIKFK